jgi:hypothetical protein
VIGGWSWKGDDGLVGGRLCVLKKEEDVPPVFMRPDLD